MKIKGLHTHLDIVKRGEGASVVAKAAYNAREKITDERYGKSYDYSKKTDLIFSKVFLPSHIPKRYENRSLLWNEIEKIEKSKNAQLARNVLFALPRELSDEENKKLLEKFIKENFTDKGMIADCNVHKPIASDGEKNPHAHILLTLREMDEKGEWKQKSKKEYVLDENGEKIKLPSGYFKSRKVSLNDWDSKDKAGEWRKGFEKCCNEFLEKKNFDVRVDLRSFKEQGREEEPQIHLGVSASAMERKGVKTERGNINRMIINGNKVIQELKKELFEIQNFITNFVSKVRDKFKRDIKNEYVKEPKSFNIYDYLEVYNLIQEMRLKDLEGDNKVRKSQYDSKKRLEVLSFMSREKIHTLLDYELKKDEVFNKQKEIKSNISLLENKFKKLETLKKQVLIMKDTENIYNKYLEMDNSIFSKIKGMSKEKYYEENKVSIDKYKRAKAIYEKVSNEEKLNLKDIKKQRIEIDGQIQSYNNKLKFMEKDVTTLKQIRYELEVASKELNLDINFEINLEIEKAIAKGEKPSTIEMLNRLKKNIEKEDRRDKAIKYKREKYKDKEDR